jgi:hypothetical protein
LSIFATGLGQTNPGVDPGQSFPSSPPATVNSPVEVMVNGKPAEVLRRRRLPWSSGRLSSELSSACGHGKRNGGSAGACGMDRQHGCEYCNPMISSHPRRSSGAFIVVDPTARSDERFRSILAPL